MANRNFITKQRRKLSKDIVGLRNMEVLGLKSCDMSWEDAFRRFLIIDVLLAPPCNGLSSDDVACLEARLGEKCNC
jgi:hypothetical protein